MPGIMSNKIVPQNFVKLFIYGKLKKNVDYILYKLISILYSIL